MSATIWGDGICENDSAVQDLYNMQNRIQYRLFPSFSDNACTKLSRSSVRSPLIHTPLHRHVYYNKCGVFQQRDQIAAARAHFSAKIDSMTRIFCRVNGRLATVPKASLPLDNSPAFQSPTRPLTSCSHPTPRSTLHAVLGFISSSAGAKRVMIAVNRP